MQQRLMLRRNPRRRRDRRQRLHTLAVERFQNSNHMRPSKRQHFADQDAKLQRISFMESMV
jgi:hypothetical protein